MDNLGWNKMVLMWDWHDLAARGWPGWDRSPTRDEPLRFDLTIVMGKDRSSREWAIEFDDLAEGRFYYRDWTDSGLPFVDAGKIYRSAFWFERRADRIKFGDLCLTQGVREQ